ncbi:MAG: AEC family transporter [Prevotella sp.]|nr:AEC family transporter [Prevotella sp.]
MLENIEIMVILLLIVVVGYVAGKRGYLDEAFNKRLSLVIIDITCPALILSSVMGDRLPDSALILPLLSVGTLTYLTLIPLSFLLPRIITSDRSTWGIHGFCITYGNVGFIGYPIVASLFGHEAVFYAALLNVPNTLSVFVHGSYLINSGHDSKAFHPKILYSTPMLAAYIAILIVAFGWTGIPKVVSQSLSLIGAITIPAALMVIGSSMSRLSIRQILGGKSVYIVSLLRLGAVPLAMYGLFTLLGFDPFVVNINTVIIAMPVATYGTILCLRYNRDVTLITETTFITTLLSVLTIPLITLLFG